MPTHFDIVYLSLSYLSSHIHGCYEKFVYSIRTTPRRIGYKSVLLNCSPRTTDGPRRSAGCFGRKSIAQIVSRHLTNEKRDPHMSVVELPLLVNLQQQVGELVLYVTSCPTVIILKNALN
jgi:hypothetical protein